MIVKTRIFELSDENYKNLSELAKAMGISISQVYRVREGKRSINQKFIVGAIKAFPEYKLDDLFYLAPGLPTVTNSYRHQDSTDGKAAKEKQGMESTQQALEKFTSAIERYDQHLSSHTSAIMSLTEASQELKKGAEEANKVLTSLGAWCGL